MRQALNHRRWCWRHHRGQVSIDVGDDGKSAALDLRDDEASPYDQYATAEMQAAVRSALEQIPTVFRSAVLLRDLEGLSYEEVAEVLEVSVGTVKSRILRGRRLLKTILDPLLHSTKESSRANSAAHAPNSSAEHSPQISGPAADQTARSSSFSDAPAQVMARAAAAAATKTAGGMR